MRVGIAKTEAEREAAYRLRYKVFTEEMGLSLVGSDTAKRSSRDGLDDVATMLTLHKGDTLIAGVRSIRVSDAFGREPDFPGLFRFREAFPDVRPEQATFSSYLVIDPAWRKSRALSLLLNAIYEQGRNNGVWLDLVSCEPSLVSLYEALGYRRYLAHPVEFRHGMRVPLALVGDDVPYLRKIGSAFARLAEKFPADPRHGAWYAERFAAYAEPSCARVMGSEEFVRYLSERVHPKADDLPLTRGMSDEEARTLLSSGTIIRGRAGDPILRAGDSESDLYMVLKGRRRGPRQERQGRHARPADARQGSDVRRDVVPDARAAHGRRGGNRRCRAALVQARAVGQTDLDVTHGVEPHAPQPRDLHLGAPAHHHAQPDDARRRRRVAASAGGCRYPPWLAGKGQPG